MKLFWPRLPLCGKVFLVCAGLAAAVSLCGGIVLYKGASQSLRQEAREHLKMLAKTAALQVDPRLHRQIKTRADETSEPYYKLKSVLAAVRDANPGVRSVYTMRRMGRSNIWHLVVDVEENPAKASHVGDQYDASRHPEMRWASYGPAVEDLPDEDQQDNCLSAYAPIRDSTGRTEAIIGLDMSLDRLREKQYLLRRAARDNTLLSLLVGIMLSLLITRMVLRPVRVFTQAVQRVRNGELDFQVRMPGFDGIGEFANAFNEMVAEIKEAKDWLMEESTRDFLTGLYNHRHFQERLASEIERAERYKRDLCLLLLDVDRFKSINDMLGHSIGDGILRQLGGVLKRSVRGIDLAARYGGDEIAVILPETNVETGKNAAERIRAEVESQQFHAIRLDQLSDAVPLAEGNRVVNLTVTIGLANYPEHHRTRDGLIMAADIALCRAKHVSRNTVSVYDPTSASDAHLDPQQLYQMLRDPDTAAIQSLAAAVDAKDRYTHGHSERVTDYALRIAEALGASPETLDAVKVAGLLHDLGKIGVPDSILNKPGSLTQEELEAIKQHPSVGSKILSRAPQLDLIIPAVLFHHERWDGAGYPDGLSGKSIPLMARVLAIADAFDAMTSDRPYRKAMSVEEAVIELRANAGRQFDPDLVEVFIGTMERERKLAA